MDTMGQAAAMTGGYGNSYAQTVGQQTYQGYLQGLNDKVPELYQLALQRYQQEGDALMDQYGLLADRENTDYGRYRDQVGDYNSQLEYLYNLYNNERGFDYGAYRDNLADSQWQAEFDENNRRYNQEWAAANAAASSSGSGGGGGYDTHGYTEAEIRALQNAAGIDVDGSWGPQTEKAYQDGFRPEDDTGGNMDHIVDYVKRMLDNATSSQFNPEAAINANSNLSAAEKAYAQEVLDAYISGGYMKGVYKQPSRSQGGR